MVMTVVLGVLVVALLVKIVVGPQRWHDLVTEHTRPGSRAPDTQGQELVVTRDVAALLVLGVLAGVALTDWVGQWRTDQRLYDAASAAVDILPHETLEAGQVQALAEELTGHGVLLLDASGDDEGMGLYDVYWAPDDLSVPEEELDLPAPAACLAIDRTSIVRIDVTEGSCAEREE